MGSHKAARKIGKAKVVCLAPDVCKTLGGTPVPFNVTAKLHLSENVSPNVNFTGCPAFTIASNTMKTWGDELGVKFGLKSGTVGEKCEPITKSDTIRINGNWLVRHDDTFHMNNKNTMGKLSYPNGGGAGSVSDAGFSMPSFLSGGSSSLFTQQGMLNKLSQIGKKLAMDAVMGKDPIDSLKQMVNPRNLIQEQIAGMAGPVGSMIAPKLLDQVLGRKKKGKQTKGQTQGKKRAKNPLSGPGMTKDLLLQSGLTPQHYVNQMPDEEKLVLREKIMQTNVAAAFAKSQVDILKVTGSTHGLREAHKTYFDVANTCIKLSEKKQLSPKIDWQAMLNKEGN